MKLCYPELEGRNGSGWWNESDGCNEWIQTSNPVSATTITGFKAIKLSFTKNGIDGSWRGIGKSEDSRTLIDDTPGQSNWWSAIGATTYFFTDKRIPGPRSMGVKKVVLYFNGKGRVKNKTKSQLDVITLTD